MKTKILLPFFLLSIFFLTSFTYPHKFYTSITQINYNDKTQSYEIIMNVFWDDWEKALSEIQQREVRIDKPGIEQFTQEYLSSHFVMKYKEKKLNYKFIGLEQEKDIIKLYLELPHKYIEKGLNIKNDCLIAELDGQVNIVNWQHQGTRKTLVFKDLNQFQEIK
jgi:hypothetical protein